jgi:hypothetical protein
VDVVGEDALAVDLDHRQPLAVAPLELGVAADVDRLELEPQLLLQRLQLPERPLAEVAARGVEDDDPRDRAPG